ncbi:hypothetical protein [Paenisporosarcina sp. TG20]|uniref:hypothetical protein n=1 Tax=Paenisporosarcina sp. TG20 TaxID=1211706 RepID=UPI00030C7ACD|nr:hypothetical protein [Paenisporosarcina sp. TG20]
MRNALKLPNGFVVTSDNSAGIGEKQADIVYAMNDVVSYFASRVALLEQWAAFAEVDSVILQNFTSEAAWDSYMIGIKRLLEEVDLGQVPISGSSESNMELMQSAMSVTMIGRTREIVDCDVTWFINGQPYVGNEVLENIDVIADMNKIKEAIANGWVRKVWPVGSKGIQAEAKTLLKDESLVVVSELDVVKSAGPSTVVLLGIPPEYVELSIRHFGNEFRELIVM